jgi:hypothetical protein
LFRPVSCAVDVCCGADPINDRCCEAARQRSLSSDCAASSRCKSTRTGVCACDATVYCCAWRNLPPQPRPHHHTRTHVVRSAVDSHSPLVWLTLPVCVRAGAAPGNTR